MKKIVILDFYEYFKIIIYFDLDYFQIIFYNEYIS